MNNDDTAPSNNELIIAYLLPLVFYGTTVCPTIGFGDTAILIDTMQRPLVSSHVNNHPFTVLAGYLFSFLPWGNPAWRSNLVSVVFGALAVGTLYRCQRELGASKRVALVCAAVMAVSHSLWWHSTIVENYAASAFLITVTYLCLIRMTARSSVVWLYAACFVAGLSIFNHVQNGMLCLGVALAGVSFALRTSAPIRTIGTCAACAVAGLVPWLALVLRDSSAFGFSDALKNAFFGKFEGTFFSAPLPLAIKETAYVIWHQSLLLFPVTCGLIGIVSTVLSQRRRPLGIAAAVHVGLTVVIFSGYPTWDKFAFLLAAFMGLGVFSAEGVRTLCERLPVLKREALLAWGILSAVISVVFYSQVTTWARNPQSMWATRYGNGYSGNLYDQARFITNPDKRGYREVEDFAEALFAALPPDATFLDDDSRTYYPLADYFQRYLGKRRDLSVLLVNSWGFSDWGMTAGDLTEVVERAYLLDKPFFVASIGSPYSTFFAQVSKRIPLRFDTFRISDNRWVYKMKTVSEITGSAASLRELEQRGVFRPIVLTGASGEADVSPVNLLFSSADLVILQKMDPFGAGWTTNDQVFVGAGGTGASAEFVLESSPERTAHLVFNLTTGPDFGEAAISLDGKAEKTVDLYSPVVSRVSVDLGQRRVPETGLRLGARVVGKSDASSGFNLGIDSVSFD